MHGSVHNFMLPAELMACGIQCKFLTRKSIRPKLYKLTEAVLRDIAGLKTCVKTSEKPEKQVDIEFLFYWFSHWAEWHQIR